MIYNYDAVNGTLVCSREIDGELVELQRFRLPISDLQEVYAVLEQVIEIETSKEDSDIFK